MWTVGILLVADILEELRKLSDLFGTGDALIWGALGWVILLLCIIFVGYPLVEYVRNYLELKRAKAVCEHKKENNRIKLEGEKLEKEKIKEAYEKRRKELEKERKRMLEVKLNLRENFVSDVWVHFFKGKMVKQMMEGLSEDIKEVEKEMSELEEQYETDVEESLRICEKLQKKVEKNERQIEEAECKRKKNKIILKEKMMKRKAACAGVFIMLLANGNNMLVTAQELKDTLIESLDSSIESQANEPGMEKPVLKDGALENEEKDIEIFTDTDNDLREHMEYNFILEDEQLNKVMRDDIADIIFLAGYPKDEAGYRQFLANCREGNIKEILPEVNGDKNLSLDELLNEIAVELEAPFLEEINEGKTIRTQTEWEQSGPRSMELKNIIDKRRQVLGMKDSISVRRTIYFRLANDCQRLGKECLIQEKSDKDIYYYYGMSIYCCYCALGYERYNENSYSDEKILNYIKARYKDISDNVKEESLPEEVNSAKRYIHY